MPPSRQVSDELEEEHAKLVVNHLRVDGGLPTKCTHLEEEVANEEGSEQEALFVA